MGKISPVAAKYLIRVRLDAKGIVEKPDVVGAIFGQTEGLLGTELELREIQKSGRIGRIEVDLESRAGLTKGEIQIPSSMDKAETAIIAASMETIDRIGPCLATIKVVAVEDVRISKRKFILDRAKEILKQLVNETLPETLEITESVRQSVMVSEIVELGPERVPAGPDVKDSDEIIIVEGRADVLNLLRNGIKNAVAVGGTNVPKAVADLSRGKTTTLFVDGDRGGELIFKALQQVAEIDFIARAPAGKEVEELAKKEIHKALQARVAVEQIAGGSLMDVPSALPEAEVEEEPTVPAPEMNEDHRRVFRKQMDEMIGTRAASLLDSTGAVITRVPLSELQAALHSIDNVEAVVVDGIISDTLVEQFKGKHVKYIVGMRKALKNEPAGVRLVTPQEL